MGLKGDSDNRDKKRSSAPCFGVFPRRPKRGAGTVACTSLHTGRKNVPLPLNEQFQWLVALQNCVCSGWREQFSGEDKAQHAQGRCRGMGWDMPQVDAKVGARVQPVGEERTMKVMVTKREKGER